MLQHTVIWPKDNIPIPQLQDVPFRQWKRLRTTILGILYNVKMSVTLLESKI